MQTLPTLYHTNAKGQTYEWSIWTEGADVVTRYGTVGGELQIARKTAVAKNVGRSNEVTPEDQARLEAAATWKKKKDKKYTETQGEKHTFEAPMLADSWDKHSGRIVFPCYVQPKLDGMRALLRFNKDRKEWELWSRSGKQIETCAHITEAATNHLSPEMELDGELYAHGLSFEDNTRLVKKVRPETAELVKFHVFDDCNTSFPFRTRWRVVSEAFLGPATYMLPDPFVRVETRSAESMAEVDEAHFQFIEDGYEGSIIRNRDGMYVCGKRSRDVLKRKDFLDAEYEVVDYRRGVGKFADCPIFTCITPDDQRFDVTPRGSQAARRQMLLDAPSYIGKLMNVRYQNLTEAGIPRFPVGCGIRESWDL